MYVNGESDSPQDNLLGYRTLKAVSDRELNALTLFKGSVSISLDGGEVNKQVLAIITDDETEALGGVEPLDGTALSVAAHLVGKVRRKGSAGGRAHSGQHGVVTGHAGHGGDTGAKKRKHGYVLSVCT